MSGFWNSIVSQFDAIGGQGAIDTTVPFIVLTLAMAIVWFLWSRRIRTQSSHIRSLENEQLRLTAELATLLQRYEIALRGSNVTVFTQDRDLRYTSISNDFLGYKVDEIIDRTDADLIPLEYRETVLQMKRAVLESGQSKDRELQISDGQIPRWYDFHIEPVRGSRNRVVGLTCAVVDITASKEGEEHLRLLMREISHRSKNLLAIIQSMARQTARYSDTIDDFLNQFNARVQALARSHDLLVQENWHGAGLRELLQSQISPYVDSDLTQITIEGPAILLKPETAQNLGLALHELASNASKYGALSVPSGRIVIRWSEGDGKDDGVELTWAETGGPTIGVPQKRGFGSMLIQQNLSRSLESEVDLKFKPDGVNCRILIPKPHLHLRSPETEKTPS